MRAIAVITAYNEALHIRNCIRHLVAQGLSVYLIDNQSTDDTVRIASEYLQRGVIAIDTLDRSGVFSLNRQLRKKEAVFDSLDADWVMHVDADEIHMSPAPDMTLVAEFKRAEAEGFNAMEFMEFTFLPTREHPSHAHPDYMGTMRHYYAFRPRERHLVRAWRKSGVPIRIEWSAGHDVSGDNVRISPRILWMKHYMCLSYEHAVWKYSSRGYDPEDLARGWFRARSQWSAQTITLPSEAELKIVNEDGRLDSSSPRRRHYFEDARLQHHDPSSG